MAVASLGERNNKGKKNEIQEPLICIVLLCVKDSGGKTGKTEPYQKQYGTPKYGRPMYQV